MTLELSAKGAESRRRASRASPGTHHRRPANEGWPRRSSMENRQLTGQAADNKRKETRGQQRYADEGKKKKQKEGDVPYHENHGDPHPVSELGDDGERHGTTARPSPNLAFPRRRDCRALVSRFRPRRLGRGALGIAIPTCGALAPLRSHGPGRLAWPPTRRDSGPVTVGSPPRRRSGGRHVPLPAWQSTRLPVSSTRECLVCQPWDGWASQPGIGHVM